MTVHVCMPACLHVCIGAHVCSCVHMYIFLFTEEIKLSISNISLVSYIDQCSTCAYLLNV